MKKSQPKTNGERLKENSKGDGHCQLQDMRESAF